MYQSNQPTPISKFIQYLFWLELVLVLYFLKDKSLPILFLTFFFFFFFSFFFFLP